MAKIRQHVPNFAQGFKPQESEFSSKEELFDTKWVNNYTKYPNFHRFVVSDDHVLMIESEDRTWWWAVGYLHEHGGILKDVPVWKPNEPEKVCEHSEYTRKKKHSQKLTNEGIMLTTIITCGDCGKFIEELTKKAGDID